MSDHDHDHGDEPADPYEPAPKPFLTPDQHHIAAIGEQLRAAHESIFDLTTQLAGSRARSGWLETVVLQLQQQLSAKDA